MRSALPSRYSDRAGVVLASNRAWRAAAAARSGVGVGIAQGANYLDACGDAGGNEPLDGVAAAAAARQVIAGERAVYRYDYPAGGRWYALCVSGVAGDDAARAIVSREDITERRRAESLLGLEHRVLCCLGAADSATDALKSVIRAVCETQGWNCGRYFGVDRSAGTLYFRESWGMPAAAVGQFLEKSGGLVFRSEAGVAGRVYRSGQPLWVLDGSRDTGVSRTALAPETGEEGAFAFPVISEDAVVGVLAFSNPTIREPDDLMLRTVHSIGRQLGKFLHRQQSWTHCAGARAACAD